MEAVLAYAVVLLIAVLVSGLAHRTILSTAVIFLVAGFVAGDSVLGIVSLTPEDPVVGQFAELALFAVLFTDGMQVGLRDLRSSWRLPGRALLLGMPLVFLVTALFARALLDVDWAEALLIGAVLSPTDPVFASAIVGRMEVPERLRRMLNVESGLNDGLALPVVIVLISVIQEQETHVGELLYELALGVAIGVAIPWLALRLERTRWFSASLIYEPINTFAIGLLVFALASLTHGNEFLAAFAAGVTVSTVAPRFRDAFHHFGELIAELLKLAALFVFGALIMASFLTDIGLTGDLFVALAIIVARPLVLFVVLLGSELDWRERIAAMWFGPKGFASVVYGLLILDAGIPNDDYIFHVIAIVIVTSIILHSSTDVIVANRFREAEREEATERRPAA